jgi:hypothetical protein
MVNGTYDCNSQPAMGNIFITYCPLSIVHFNSGAYSFRLSVAADSTKAGNELVGKRGRGGNREGNIFSRLSGNQLCEYFIAHLQAADNLQSISFTWLLFTAKVALKLNPNYGSY